MTLAATCEAGALVNKNSPRVLECTQLHVQISRLIRRVHSDPCPKFKLIYSAGSRGAMGAPLGLSVHAIYYSLPKSLTK